METRKYFSLRKTGADKISLESLKEIVFSVWQDFYSRGYFQQYFGIDCTDGHIPGKAGSNLEGYALRKLRKNIWPFVDKYKEYSEEDLFDVIEFFFDHISEPFQEGAEYHSWNECGWHFKNFDEIFDVGKSQFREEINQFINDYKDGYELSAKGEILELAPANLRPLMDAIIPTQDETIKEKMEDAALKFRKYGSTLADRQHAIRDLVDCFEQLKPKLKDVLASKDESDLFNIANNFSIRHANQQQKTNYDKNIWLSWMFYFYYSTLMTSLHMLRRIVVTEKSAT